MEEQIYREELIQLIWSTLWLLSILQTVRQCNPPDWLVGAGVMRNLVWDHLHQYQTPTPLADIDVIFFDPRDVHPERDHMVQQQLAQRLPGVDGKQPIKLPSIFGMKKCSVFPFLL